MIKLLSTKPSARLTAYILLALLIISMLPVVRLSSYAIPWYDDYGYTKYTVSFREAYGDSFFNAVKGALYQSKESWWAWQGTYSTTFISALSPLAWGSEYYPLGACFLVILSCISSLVMFKAVAKHIFGMEKYGALAFASAATLLVIQKCAYPGHAFYWFNGGVHYMGMASFFMLYIASLISFPGKRSKAVSVFQLLISCLLAFIVAGGNYVTLLQGMMIIPFVIIYEFAKHKRYALRLLPSAAVYLAGFYMNVSAPGNSVRGSAYTQIATAPLKAVIISIQTAIQKLPAYTDVFLIVIMVLLIPVIWKALEGSEFSFRYPLIFVIMALGIYTAGYTPPVYAMGAAEVPRILNACKLGWHAALLLSEIYVIGWIRKKKEGGPGSFDGRLWQYCLGAAIVMIAFLIGRNVYSYTSTGALYELCSGEADAFRAEYSERLDSIEKQQGDVRVKPYTHMTFYLTQGDLSYDPAAEENTTMASWYRKDSIALE